MNRLILKWMCILTGFLMLSACTSINKKIKPSVRADVGAFADHTIAMLNDADFGISENNALYIKEFLDNSEPEEIRFEAALKEVHRVLLAIVNYSLRLVSITDVNHNSGKRIEAYVEYLGQIDDGILDALELDEDYYTDLLREVGEQEKFMDALKYAQPLIDALGRYMEKSLDGIEVAAEVLEDKIDMKIDVRYADLIRYQTTLENEKYAILFAFEQLHLSGKGEVDAYRRLKNGDTVVPVEIVPDGPLTYTQRWEIAKHLIGTLDMLDRIWKETEPDWELYRNTHLELDRLHLQLYAETRKLRLITLLWLRAHYKMASGISSPAEWFNMKETTSLLIKSGARALF